MKLARGSELNFLGGRGWPHTSWRHPGSHLLLSAMDETQGRVRLRFTKTIWLGEPGNLVSHFFKLPFFFSSSFAAGGIVYILGSVKIDFILEGGVKGQIWCIVVNCMECDSSQLPNCSSVIILYI